MSETQIKLAAKMYQCRDAAKKIYGSQYFKKIGKYKEFINAAMVKHGIDNEIKAAIKLIEDCKDNDGSGVAVMNIMAACVEIIEPTKEKL